MANTIYVNVGGTWKTVSNYYVNVSGTWKTGTEFRNNVSGIWKGSTIPTSATFPTALDIAELDYAEFMCMPIVYIASKQGIDGDTLDTAYWQTAPAWVRESTFVYSAPPAPGPSTLPTIANILGLDTAYWQTYPIIMLSTSGSSKMDDLDVAEFMCVPHWGLTPDAPSSPPVTPELPTAANIETLDYPEFMCMPSISIASKQGINGNSLDTSYWQTSPFWFRESEFVYVAPPAPGPSILPTAADIKTLDTAYWQTAPKVHVVSKSTLNGASLDYAEFMCVPHFTKNL